MSWTVTTTTKVFPTDTPDVTPASDDRIMFSDTSDGWKLKDASIDQIFSWYGLVSAWTSYTPTVSGTSWSVWSYTDRLWYYKVIGKTCFQAVNLYFSKWTLSWPVTVTNATTAASNMQYNTVHCVLWDNNATSRYTTAEINGANTNRVKNLWVWVVQFSDLWTDIRIRWVFAYETI